MSVCLIFLSRLSFSMTDPEIKELYKELIELSRLVGKALGRCEGLLWRIEDLETEFDILKNKKGKKK